MKKILLLASIISYSLTTIAQGVWQKNDRQNVMDEGISLLSKYDNIPKDKKELIGKCYMDFITVTYKLDAYKNLIDYELKSLQKTTITKCAKDIGYDLEEQKVEVKKAEPEANKATKENLVGSWKDEESEFSLFPTGDFVLTTIDGGKKSKGTWKIDGNVLTLYHEKTFMTKQKDFKILIFTNDQFVYQSVKNKKDTFTVTRKK